MKKMLLLSLVMAFVTANGFAQAQLIKKKKVARTNVAQKGANTSSNATSGVLLMHTGKYSAYSATGNRFSIADPTITTFNERASGTNVPISSSGISGMPKGTYGYAGGKIFLRSTTASSSGTAYGSGAVGTGTSINGIGTSESTPGVNGKSNDAGPWFWGSRQPVYNAPAKTENKQ